MTVSEYIFEFISKIGCETVFMVSGSSSMWLTDSLYKNNKLNVICTHHEQAAAMAADGYGRVNGIPGACLVTIGPGATNAITGVAQAYLDSSPMFVISGQANSKLLKYEIETGIRQHGTQSLNLEPLVSSITKYFAVVMEPKDIRYHMERAYYEAIQGRKGPVWIDVPVDIQNKQIPEEMDGYEIDDSSESILSQCVIEEVMQRLVESKRPLILAGNGIRSSNSSDIMLDFANKYCIPIVTSRGGIDIISSEHELYVGRPGSYGDRASHFAIQNCDFLLILGSRLSVSTVGYYPKQFGVNAYKVMVDIDDLELEKDEVPVDLKIRCDLNFFFKTLMLYVIDSNKTNKDHVEWHNQCNEWKEKYPVVQQNYKDENPLNEYYFTDLLSKRTLSNTNIIVDTGSVCNVVSQSWKIKYGQRYLISGGLSCMGFWATAIGTVQKNRQVIAITGDGSAQMNIQELATLKYNNIPIKLFIYNNNGYMLIRHNQHNYMDDRFLGVGPDSGIQTPDYCKVAEAYEVNSIRIKKEDDIEKKIEEILNFNGPMVVDVTMQEFAPIVPRIASRVMPDGSLKAAAFDDLFPFLDDMNM